MLRIIPAIKMSAGEKIQPYARIGLSIGVMNRFYDERTHYTSLWPSGYDTYHEISVFKGGTSIGVMGAIGADYHLSDNFLIYAEVGTISQSWAPKKMLKTTYEVNGVDKLATLDKRDKETDFVDSYNPAASTPTTQASKSIKIYLPYSSWGINIGVRINFGKKKE